MVRCNLGKIWKTHSPGRSKHTFADVCLQLMNLISKKSTKYIFGEMCHRGTDRQTY